MNAYGDEVTVVSAPLATGYGGQQVRDWANAERVQFPASVQPLSTREDDQGRQVATRGKRLFTAGTVTEVDRVEWRGSTYDVLGVEEHFRQGAFDHYEATLEVHVEPAS